MSPQRQIRPYRGRRRPFRRRTLHLRGLCPILWLAPLVIACGSPERALENPASVAPPKIEATAEAAPGDPLFLDAAAASGLDFTHWNGMTGQYYYAEMMGSGVALFDFDNDGDLDIYLVQGNLLSSSETAKDALFPPPGPLPLRDRLFRNDLSADADGVLQLRFTDVTEESGIVSQSYGMGATAADFDGDGWTDLYVTNLGRNQLFRNLGAAGDSPRFEDATEVSGAGSTHWSVPAIALDYDRDGWLDLYIGNYVDFSPGSNKRCTDELGVANYCGPLAFAPVPDQLLRNLGDGTFEDVSRETGIDREYGGCLGAVAADFDSDGWIDLYVANDGMPNQLWKNSGANTRGQVHFENRALLAGAAVSGEGHPEASMGVTAADFDADGDEDLFIAHLTRETNTFYVNNGEGQFDDRSAASGLGAASYSMTGFGAGALDYDNDGQLDLVAVNGAVKIIKKLRLAGDSFPLHQPNQLFRNLGVEASGQLGLVRFEDVSQEAGAAFRASEVSRGAAFGDLDNDGDTDVVINNNNGPVRLLLNQIGQDRSWLGLRLMDHAGHSDQIGARAGIVRPDGRILWRRIGATASYASASDPRLLFGLGDDPQVVSIVARWPDGRFERWQPDQAPLAHYTILRQGTGQAWDGETR